MASAALCVGGAAWAGDDHEGGGDSSVTDSLRVHVRAQIQSRCGLLAAPQSQGSASNLTTAQTLDHPFTLDCNTPFAVGVSSQHGGLAYEGAGPGNGFQTRRTYNVALVIGTDGGGTIHSDPCTSQSLMTGQGCAFYGVHPGDGLNSGRKTSINRPSDLIVSWPNASAGEPRFIAGAYQDTLTIVVGPRC